ncbi:CoA-binding protein, partial [Candidatus Daviesbacteria bacterium]|nr:CoA-binding protein [Candidatus Daviesbacteria bacterium]
YANLNYLVKKHKQSAIFVLGPGHGFPALQANLFLEGTLGKYYKEATLDGKGIAFISKTYGWPDGFSSHSNPEAPGLILEGGELGYSLSTAYGAVLDNPDLLAVCMIGDGEAETGPIATSWHINKLIDLKKNGTVLPILHLNGLKISGPTIFGRMSDEELISLFKGYGYEPFVVGGDNVFEDMLKTMEACLEKIKKRSHPLPMIILKTPKGWTTIKELNNQKIEGTILSHHVVMPNVKGNDEELAGLESWLRSYQFNQLFDPKTGFNTQIKELIPTDQYKIGNNPHMFGKAYRKLNLPDAQKLAKKIDMPGTNLESNSLRMAGTYLKEIFDKNKKQKNFRLFSPDETYSNRLDEVFEVTSRAFSWPIKEEDKDLTSDGRVMEMLSEHNMHGLAQGYVLTGRHAVIATYEAFAQIFSSMAHAYQKFLKYVRKMPWREDIPSLNYILTATAWRQEHNGYSHQNPSFVTGMLEKHNDFIKAWFPADDNSMLAVLEEVMASKNQMNIITAGKTPLPRWLSLSQAKEALKDGLSIWDFASEDNPDIVVCGIGDYTTLEALAAIDLIKKDAPEIKIRFVNVLRLQAACSCEDQNHPQIPNAEKYFTNDKPVIVNFHAYPESFEAIISHLPKPERFSVHGYIENGATTTPFDLQVKNKTSRFHLAQEILEQMSQQGVISAEVKNKFIDKYQQALNSHQQYIKQNGADPVEIENWVFSGKIPVRADVAEVMHADLLKNAQTIAIIGLSDKPDRESYRVGSYFMKRGFKVIPVNPNITHFLGEKAYPDLKSIPKEIKIDIVDVFRRADLVMPHMKEIVDRGGIKTVWLQEGVSSKEVEDFAEDYGLTMVTNCCIMEAYKRLEKS